MVEIHLYGDLRKYSKDFVPIGDILLTLEPDPGETLASLLARTGIPEVEINHVFFNSKLLVSRNRMASLYSLQQVASDVTDWNLAVPVAHGDRIGLFGLDIPLLSM
jgi:hypothetical protein